MKIIPRLVVTATLFISCYTSQAIENRSVLFFSKIKKHLPWDIVFKDGSKKNIKDSRWTAPKSVLNGVGVTTPKGSMVDGTNSGDKPDDRKLYDTIVHLDSIFFEAYNTCNQNLDKYAAFLSENLEFYHDQGGLMTSKQAVIDATKKNICGKVTRELLKGSIEVYPIKNFGAIEMGLHKFHNNQEPSGAPSKVGKFIIIWQHINNEWKITRIVSLH